MIWMAVAVGGAMGSVARHGVAAIMLRVAPQLVSPLATVAVNLAGCFAIGILGSQLLDRVSMWQHPTARAFVFIGLLGGFTTFSAFALETLILMQSGRHGLALLNAIGQPVLGLGMAYLGWWLGARV